MDVYDRYKERKLKLKFYTFKNYYLKCQSNSKHSIN